MKKYIIPLAISAIVVVSFFISQITLQEQSLSKQCKIPYDVNFLEKRSHSAPNDGKPHYTIEEKFSIYNTIPITSLKIDEVSQSLIMGVMPNSHGYIILCDPLPVLQKELDTKMDKMMVLVDGKETEYVLVNNTLKLYVHNNTSFAIVVYE